MYGSLIVTCAASDAMPFLHGLPNNELEQTTLIATSHLANAIEGQRMAHDVHVTAGVSTLRAVRQIAGCSRRPIAIVIGPDPGGPLRSKGLVRARLLAPLALAGSERADLIEVDRGGAVSRIAESLTRRALLRTIYVREASQPGGPQLRGAVAIPLTLISLARLLAFVLWTEGRARLTTRRP